ncbi:MAG: DUF559 domain-containing protein [Demequinaceae bacterium]|nr:DUF559 domain-containing protein [Demequinaceae bacterium]
MTITQTLAKLGGAARREQLLAHGVRRWELTAAVRGGQIERPHRGVYAIPGTPRRVVLARIFRASLTGVTACDDLGLPLLEPSGLIHLSVDSGRGMARPGVRPVGEVCIHHSQHAHRGMLWVELWVAIDQASTCVSRLAQLVLLDAALQKGLMTIGDLDRFTVTPLLRRRWLAANCDRRAESLLETVARCEFRSAGLRVEPQVRIPGVGRIDLMVEGSIAVELDGREYHDNPRAFARDRRRDRLLQALGYRVARFTYGEVIATPEVLGASVQGLLKAPPFPPAVRTVHGTDDAHESRHREIRVSTVISVPSTVRTAGGKGGGTVGGEGGGFDGGLLSA